MLDHHIASLDLAFFEVQEAFKGLSDENVWKRPDLKLLSVGELAGHIAYWEAVRIGCVHSQGESRPNLELCKIQSPLIDERFRYYLGTVELSPVHLSMSADQVRSELVRVHEEAVTLLKELNPDLKSSVPWWHSDWNDYLRYAMFHVSYHTGQMYSVRHLLGDTPPDN